MPRLTVRRSLGLAALLTLVWIGGAPLQAAQRAPLAHRPLAFEENRGQTDPQVKYLSRGPGHTLFLTPAEAVLALRGSGQTGSVLRLRWMDGAASPRMTADGPLPGVTHYLTGNDPSRWRTGVPSWKRVRYQEVWPGIDLVFYGNPRQLEQDVLVAPGADPRLVRLAFEGAEELRIEAAGDLVVQVGGEEVRLRRPVSYQEIDGVRREVKSAWRLVPGVFEAGFQVAAYDRSRPLIIDPVLVYSTLLGGSLGESGNDIAVDAAGNAYVAGQTQSEDFPTTAGSRQPQARLRSDAFIAKLSPEGELVYATYLGSDAVEAATGIAVDHAGSVHVAGFTHRGWFTPEEEFPLVNPLPLPLRGSGAVRAFIAKLRRDGSGLVYSTTLGGSDDVYAEDVAVDARGSAWVTGSTTAMDFPVVGAVQPVPGRYGDAFVAKLSPAGSALLVSTYLGGNRADGGEGIAVDRAGRAYITGFTESTDFPIRNAIQSLPGGLENGRPPEEGVHDAFVTKLAADGSLVYSTYLGGSSYDDGLAVAADPAGHAYVTGIAPSADFPVRHALQPVRRGITDAFVAKIAPAGGTLIYSTFLGGSGYQFGMGIAVAPNGAVTVAGSTASPDFPLVDPVDGSCLPVDGSLFCVTDGFISRLSADGQSLDFSTYLGGDQGPERLQGADFIRGVTVDARGNTWVTGTTSAFDFPLVEPFQTERRGNTDAFVARIAGRKGGPS